MKLTMVFGCSIALGLTTFVGACSADTQDEGAGGGSPDPAPGSPDAAAAPPASDAGASRCSRGFCRVDLPNANIHNLTKWMFAGVAVDPTTGVWMIANGDPSDVAATAHVLHYVADSPSSLGTLEVGEALYLIDGPSKWPIQLRTIVSDGAGNLLAAGIAPAVGAPVLVRGTGQGAFTVSRFDVAVRAAWSSGPGSTWLVGTSGAVLRAVGDGGWQSESTDGGDYFSVWGTGPNDIYAGGKIELRPPSDAGMPRDSGGPRDQGGPDDPGDGADSGPPDDPKDPRDSGPPDKDPKDSGGPGKEPGSTTYGYVAHGSRDDGGVLRWSSSVFSALPQAPSSDLTVHAGVAHGEGARFWSSEGVVARGGAAREEENWIRESFVSLLTMRSFWARNKSDVWAVGDMGRIYRYDGSAWTNASLEFNGAPLTANLTGIAGTTTGQLFIVGEGVVLRSEVP